MNTKPCIAFVGFDEESDRAWADRIMTALTQMEEDDQSGLSSCAQQQGGNPACIALRRGCDADHWPVGAVTDQTNIEHLDLIIMRYVQSPVHTVTGRRGSVQRSSASLYRLLDAVYEAGFPVIAIADDAKTAQRELSSSDIVVTTRHEPVCALLARIDALLQRQQTIMRLNSDIDVSRRCQNGLQDEVTRIHDEMRLASMIQKEFLPTRLPEIGDVRFGVFFRPVGYVSGDIFDVRRLDENTIGFFIADAVGHGVPAALITMVISRGLCMKVTDEEGYHILSPAEVLRGLNSEMIRHQYDGRRFATAVCGAINIRTHEVVIAGAGHPPPLLLSRGGATERIMTEGSLLGIFDDAPFTEARFTLTPGDRLILFSDGFEVAFPGDRIAADGRRLPNEAYIEQFRQSAMDHEHPADAIRHMVECIDSESGSLHQVDDLTAMIIATGVTTAAANADAATAGHCFRGRTPGIPEAA